MRQLLQNVSTGDLTVEEVPPPQRGPASLLVATKFSLISAGTERAVMELGRASMVSKARARPDLVKQVLDSARTEGVRTTYQKVRGRLGEPNALGYSSCGVVLESCESAPAAPGELVACAGAGLASHAEVVSVPRMLCARVPDGVDPQDAAYSTVASIALHGVRLGEVGLGDVVGIVGLGLVGQITVELVLAAGGVPVGLDLDPARAQLAVDAGATATVDADEFESQIARLTAGRGADSVLVTAASKGNEPLSLGTRVARERSVVCIVGDVAISSPRAPLFTKELRLVVSRSYGPGRYDSTYEQDGIDYPAGYVRWTEGRNLEEVLRLMSVGRLRPSRLTTHTFDLDDGPAAYALLNGSEPSLGIVLRYGEDTPSLRATQRYTPSRRRRGSGSRVRVGIVGAGSFGRGVLMPAFSRHADVVAVATRTGVSAHATARRFGASLATTDAREVIESDGVDAVVIATRHDTHAPYVKAALEAGKHVFVETPLALDAEELAGVEGAAAASDRVLMVGFNRRFAPLAVAMRDALGGRGPLMVTYRINAGRLPGTHWTHDREIGGGRIVGEVCHFVDLAAFLSGSSPTRLVSATAVPSSEPLEDNVTATLRHADGSTSVIVYTALGDPALPKERIEVVSEAGAGILDDFRELCLFRGGTREDTSAQRDKGHAAEIEAFVRACRDGVQPWPVEDMLAVTRTTFAMRDAIHQISVVGLAACAES